MRGFWAERVLLVIGANNGRIRKAELCKAINERFCLICTHKQAHRGLNVLVDNKLVDNTDSNLSLTEKGMFVYTALVDHPIGSMSIHNAFAATKADIKRSARNRALRNYFRRLTERIVSQ